MYFLSLSLILLTIHTQISRAETTCTDFRFLVYIDYTQYQFGYLPFNDNYDVATYIQDINRRDADKNFHPISGSIPGNGTFRFSGTYCEPANATTLLVATHGLNSDRTYWDIQYQPEKYNFANYVVGKGYSFLSYDLLGAGRSQVISGYTLQLPMHVAILEKILTKIRENSLFPKSVEHTVPKKIVPIGFNIGSLLTNAVIAKNASLVDAAILTGVGYKASVASFIASLFSSWNGKIASTVDKKWEDSGYDSGYLDQDDKFVIWKLLYRKGYYDTNLTDSYSTEHRYPQAIMESATVPLVNLNAKAFKSPVLVMAGENDYINCGGNCQGILGPSAREAFPNSKGFQSYIQPGAAHSLNLAYNATGGYQVIVDFLKKNGF
ncbi:uncharacterized protein EAF01_002465 [Botrytis porri]|uniref:uncharacterized protein n=1 Tax=Botrytis porri TaxID=87229 RepID=UPI0019001F2B|nr:uncharacterized protein EAF01_002465 [Botrytis porri]KAF7910957.1 hypothetical protein EAF01_002465 [Botrytis porri]